MIRALGKLLHKKSPIQQTPSPVQAPIAWPLKPCRATILVIAVSVKCVKTMPNFATHSIWILASSAGVYSVVNPRHPLSTLSDCPSTVRGIELLYRPGSSRICSLSGSRIGLNSATAVFVSGEPVDWQDLNRYLMDKDVARATWRCVVRRSEVQSAGISLMRMNVSLKSCEPGAFWIASSWCPAFWMFRSSDMVLKQRAQARYNQGSRVELVDCCRTRLTAEKRVMRMLRERLSKESNISMQSLFSLAWRSVVCTFWSYWHTIPRRRQHVCLS
jgi:hypothetical protein